MATTRVIRQRIIWGLGLVIGLSVAIGGFSLSGAVNHRTSASGTIPIDHPDVLPGDAITVTTIHPRPDASVQLTAQQYATVEPFFQADLRARASGVVRAVYKDMNDRVHRGELLVEIDVPDRDIEARQKAGVIEQREQELHLAEAKIMLAEADLDVAKAVVKQRKAEVGEAAALRDAKRKQLVRVREMARRDAIQPERVEEVERDTFSAESGVEAANAMVEKANADVKEKAAGVLAAKADVTLKRSLVNVARLDYEWAAALADFARIRAPFDGVVVRRNVDPGSFVQNATTGSSEPLISIARTDIVTISAKFPDNQAMFISRNTPATVELDDLPNATIPAYVTRYSPSIRNNDRTMTVEVDLFNGTPTEFKQLAARAIATGLAPLATISPIGVCITRVAVNDYFANQRKGADDELAGPAFGDEHASASRLLPGMTGIVRLQLSRFGKSYAVPTSAIYTRGGKPYLLIVKEGVTHQTPIHIHVNDGSLAKVSIVAKVSDGHGSREVLRELSGAEEIVASRQLEVGDGREVQTAPSEW